VTKNAPGRSEPPTSPTARALARLRVSMALSPVSRMEPREVLIGMVGSDTSLRRVREASALLARSVRRSEPFSPSYLYNVMEGRQPPAGELLAALRAWWEHANGGHHLAGAFEPVQVRAVPGTVATGALILGHSVRCPREGCGIDFVPRTQTQRFCSRECQILAYRSKGGNA